MLSRFYIAFDPQSQKTLRRFAVTVGVAAFVALFAEVGYRLMFFAAMIGVAIAVSAALAMMAKERFDAPSLNRWDETFAYIALSVLVY